MGEAFNAISAKGSVRGPNFTNGLFASFDIETVKNDAGLECVYMISWVVSLGPNTLKGVVFNIDDLYSDDAQALLVRQFLEGLYAHINELKGA